MTNFKEFPPSDEPSFLSKFPLEEYLSAAQSGDSKKIAAIKKGLLADNFAEAETVEALFGFLPAAKEAEKLESLDAKKDGWEKIKKSLKNTTEYNFLLTDFIHRNHADKEFLKQFWALVEKVANESDKQERFMRLKRGILSQVSAWRALEEAGLNPQLSHPSEDALESIDFWTERGEAVQVKGAPEKNVTLIPTDEAAFPGLMVREATGDRVHINSRLFAESQKFQAKLDKHDQGRNGKTRGFFLVMPYGAMDFDTGEPSQEVIKAFKNLTK